MFRGAIYATVLVGGLWAGAVCASGCATSPEPEAAETQTLPACTTAAPPATWSYPAGPYGKLVGDRFEDLSLFDCDGKQVAFSEILGDAKVVLFNVGSGWCQPCIDEAKELEPLYRTRCGKGLRVVQVLFQDEDGLPAPKAFCRDWRKKFGMSFPVLVDPLFKTQRYFEASQTPLNLLVDHTGTIRMQATGQVPPDLNVRIDQLLAE